MPVCFLLVLCLEVQANGCVNFVLPCRAHWVKVYGTKYQTPCAVVVGRSDEDDELQFGHVTSVLVYAKQEFFESELMHVQFCEHYHAYALSLPPLSLREKYLIAHRNLPHFHPYGMYHCRLSSNTSLQYTVLRSNVYI